jgi:hypothetical protein
MSTPIPIILDQKDWIYLARGRSGEDSVEDAAKYLRTAVRDNKVILPLSIIHFGETVKRLDEPSRRRLATFVFELSEGNTIAPAPTAIKFEIDNACRRLRGNSPANLQKIVFGKGIAHMLGSKGVIESSHPEEKEVENKILEKIESPETILQLMNIGFAEEKIKALNEHANASAEKVEQIRKQTASIKDMKLRYLTQVAEYFHGTIDPPLLRCLLTHGVPATVMEPTFASKEKIFDFFKSIPTAYCFFELDFYRDSQQQRKIQPNDLHDIAGLAIAIPYAKIVVTEPFWQNGINSRKLDSINNAVVLTSRDLPNLSSIIESLF